MEQSIFKHIGEQLMEMGCKVRAINGMPDHVHLLFMLNPQKALTDVLKQIKGNTSHWINGQNTQHEKFAWQTGYAAYSVSESQLGRIHDYILRQKEHHSKWTFGQEYEKFAQIHGIIFDQTES